MGESRKGLAVIKQIYPYRWSSKVFNIGAWGGVAAGVAGYWVFGFPGIFAGAIFGVHMIFLGILDVLRTDLELAKRLVVLAQDSVSPEERAWFRAHAEPIGNPKLWAVAAFGLFLFPGGINNAYLLLLKKPSWNQIASLEVSLLDIAQILPLSALGVVSALVMWKRCRAGVTTLLDYESDFPRTVQTSVERSLQRQQCS